MKEQFHLAEYVFLGGEGHLQVDLVELARAAVGPGSLVPEARGDLEVALDAAHHQKLFELLGSLGQGVKLTGVEPAGHEVVPGAFGRGHGEHRRLHFEEPACRQVGPHELAEACPLGQPLDQRAPAHVEVAVTEPGLLAHVAVALDRERQHVGRGQDLEAGHLDLHLPGGQFGVDRVRRPGHHRPGHSDHALEAQARQGLESGVAGVGDKLDHPGTVVASQVCVPRRRQVGVGAGWVTQVYKEQAAVVPLGRHPPGQLDGGADVGGAESAATGAAVPVGRWRGVFWEVGHSVRGYRPRPLP